MDYLLIRLLCSFLTGALLSQAGSFIQLATKNILASPSTLGFEGVGVLWILVLHSLFLFLGIESTSMVFSLSAVPVGLLLAGFYFRRMNRKNKFERLILIGLTFNLLVGAVFSLWHFLFLAFNLPFPVELWFGHFRYAELTSLIILVFLEGALLAGLFFLRREIVLLSLGPGIAANFLFTEERLYRFLLMSVAVISLVTVALFGGFAFLGLIFPIIARKIWFRRFDLQGELVWGAGANGLFLMLIDFLCYRFPVYGAEIPVGLLMTGVGALSLMMLLWKSTHGISWQK